METPMDWELTDHTADFGLRVFGKDLEALFRNAALAVYDLMTDRSVLAATDTVSIRVEGDDRPDLMVNWLREVLYCWIGHELLVKDVIRLDLTAHAVHAELACAPFDAARHEILHEIKAVTYHDIDVSETADGYCARIILDV